MEFTIEEWMVKEAETYAVLSAAHTSNRHDFHRGGITAKAEKMFEGKLGEKVFKAWLRHQRLPFEEDATSHEEADMFDFRVAGRTIDVKTFTKDFHRRLLEMVEQYDRTPKDYYVAVRLRFEPFSVTVRTGSPVFDFSQIHRPTSSIVGWASKIEVGQAPIENNGYRDNRRLWLADLHTIDHLASELRGLVVAHA
jgi:hypothetical protein